jgi:ribosomal protein L23
VPRINTKVKGANGTIKKLKENYDNRLDWEKYMCPNGLKPTITSNFKKPQLEHEFVNIDLKLLRSPKPMDQDWMAFRTTNDLSKPEIKQYLSKLYGMTVERVDTVRTQGKVFRSQT